MKKLRGFLLLLILSIMSLGAAHGIAQAQNTSNFTISSFTADYYVTRNEEKNSRMRVEEEIIAQFPSYDQNHGILRAIPTKYKNSNLRVNVLSVTDQNSNPYQYETSKQNDNLVLRIGDPARYAHGATVYRISYELENVITFYDDHDELYWDVNGDQWDQTFGVVTTRIHIPADIAAGLQERQLCFVGSFGQASQNCMIRRSAKPDNQDAVEILVQAYGLNSSETLTFVLGFNDGTFTPNAFDEFMRRFLPIFIVVGGLIPILFTSIFIIIKWRKYGRDPKGKGVIVPQYVPPKELNALSSDVVLHERLRTQALSALIIELAIKKYIHIYELPRKGWLAKPKYELELTKPAKGLSSEEQGVVRIIFGDNAATGKRVELAKLQSEIYPEAQKLSKSVPTDLYQKGYFTNDPNKIRSRYALLGVLIVIVGGVSFFLANLTIATLGLSFGIVISGIIILLASSKMPARSIKGVAVRDYLLGLRDYMKLAEADRIQYLQSPEGVRQFGDPTNPKNQVKLFEKLLPYAMLFGIEKDWAKQFNDLYKQPPQWYSGNWSTFSAVYLVSSLNTFGTVTTTSFSPPGSSGSSGFSGGGGFAGGGGGGGGGGGW